MIIVIIKQTNKIRDNNRTNKTTPPTKKNKKTAIETIKTLEIVSENHCPNTVRP